MTAAYFISVPRGTLFSEAEAAEQSVEDILDTGAAGQSVKRRARQPQVLGDQDIVVCRRSVADRISGIAKMPRLPAIERNCVLRRKN
jgi:hypothetical protein